MKKFILALILLSGPAGLFAQRDTVPYGTEGFREAVAKFNEEPVITGRVIFLGNSITAGGNWKQLLKDSAVINRGISGDITFGILSRLDEVIRRKPSKVFLLIGINDISKNIPDETIMENIFSIAGRIRSGSPKTAIFIQSILPTNSTFKDFPNHKNKDNHVNAINNQLGKYGDRLGYTYIDLYSKFLDEGGRLDARYTTDGLHLNALGYQQWITVLKSLKHL